MTKQELINAYQAEYEKRYSNAEQSLKMLKQSADEEDAVMISQDLEIDKIVASMCKQFINNLQELED